MRLTHDFPVPADADHAWELLLDLPRVAGCMPGAAIDSFDGEAFAGSVKVKLGPMQIVYRGSGSFDRIDADAHTAVVTAQAKESRGSGTAKATITMSLTAAGSERTQVRVVTDLDITGKPAQLGRGLIDDVAKKLIATFAGNLAREIGAPEDELEAPAAGPSATDVLDMGSIGVTALVSRLGPPAIVGVLAAVLGYLVGRSVPARRKG